MRHTLIYSLLIVFTTLTFSLQSRAQNQDLPVRRLKAYSFRQGGGMRPGYIIYELRHDEKTDKPLLTISGECEGEQITVEVGQEVFDHCLELVDKHELSKSAGFYEPKMLVHDAPTSSFSVTFERPYKMISGSGDMPDFIWDGLNEIHKYFKSVVGDRKAEGHVDRVYGPDGIAGMHWTDGKISVTTPKESVVELKRAVRNMDDDGSTEPQMMGYTHFHEGDQHYLVIHDYQQEKHRLFYSFDGKEITRKQMALQHLASMLCGTYTDAQGREYTFYADATCQGPGDTKPQPFIVFPKAGSPTPKYYWNHKTVTGYKLTKDGVDILGVPVAKAKTSKNKSGKKTTVCHLVRANGKNEIWPVVNKRFLSQPILDALSLEQLEEMYNSLRGRRDSPYGGILWLSDIGGVNRDLLLTEMKNRGKEMK